MGGKGCIGTVLRDAAYGRSSGRGPSFQARKFLRLHRHRPSRRGLRPLLRTRAFLPGKEIPQAASVPSFETRPTAAPQDESFPSRQGNSSGCIGTVLRDAAYGRSSGRGLSFPGRKFLMVRRCGSTVSNHGNFPDGVRRAYGPWRARQARLPAARRYGRGPRRRTGSRAGPRARGRARGSGHRARPRRRDRPPRSNRRDP